MLSQYKRPIEIKESITLYSDFEVSVKTPIIGEKKLVSKGRFLYWGDVKSNDCPA